MAERLTASCPHPGCAGTLPLAADLPDGVYPCICRATNVRLRWAEVDGVRVPRLTTEEDRTDGR